MPITDTIDGIVNEPTVNFVGKDGFCWWVGEVEDHEDPMELGRVRCRVLGYYTNIRGGTTADLPQKIFLGQRYYNIHVRQVMMDRENLQDSCNQVQLLWVSLWMVIVLKCQLLLV